ncbi:MAG: hypothetical protein Q9M11_07500 [Mariprofundaceae bacterium]|nr:hypothetical protein [Mariprofundaceae bacterium]
MLTIIKHVWASALVIFILPCIAFSAEDKPYDFGIEGMRSQNYSIGILAFLFISMGVFVGVIRLFYKHTDMSQVKTGEKVLMGMIVMGVVVAAIFAVIQLLDGYLF